MTRRRHDPVIPVAALQETFWRVLWTEAPDAVADLAGRVEALAHADVISVLHGGEAQAREEGKQRREQAAEEWARRWGLAPPAGTTPAWITAMAAETVRFWIADPWACAKRVPLPWRILAVFNTDSVPHPPVVVPDPGESARDYHDRALRAVTDHEGDLVRRGLGVVNRGHAEVTLALLVRHRAARTSWDDLALAGDRDERSLRREANRLAHTLGLL